ncbi:hypothetical protein CDAR_214141 [Caerostris darwini]|uniref:Uncharacterized protein n=1 Tax=Caerostris darwini TaxID=1538125 RepID=A0AAV4S7V6_9ARAC|nr:hypothetical protein CDAR_214141 [Caerostris darwini]
MTDGRGVLLPSIHLINNGRRGLKNDYGLPFFLLLPWRTSLLEAPLGQGFLLSFLFLEGALSKFSSAQIFWQQVINYSWLQNWTGHHQVPSLPLEIGFINFFKDMFLSKKTSGILELIEI